MTDHPATSTDQILAQAKAILCLVVNDARDGEFTLDAECVTHAILAAHDLIAEVERRIQ